MIIYLTDNIKCDELQVHSMYDISIISVGQAFCCTILYTYILFNTFLNRIVIYIIKVTIFKGFK